MIFENPFHALKIAALLIALAVPLVAANFTPPVEGQAAFRRDRIPLDADSMSSLARQLVVIVRAIDPANAPDRRNAARMLAIAMSLDPANSDARRLLAAFEKNGHQPVRDSARIAAGLTRLWQFAGWLESPEAGSDGQALGACLNDVLMISDSKHPRAQALAANGERGAWNGWIAPLSAFEEPKIAPVDPVNHKPPKITKPAILLGKATVNAPMWKRAEKSDTWMLASVPLKMTAGEAKPTEDDDDEDHPFSIVIGSAGERGPLASLVPLVTRALTVKYGSLPENCEVVIGGEGLETSLHSQKRHSLSAAITVLANSALSGKEPEGTIIGTVDEKGAFKMSVGFWDQLQGLRGTGKLVLPAAAADYLPSMLALERPEFFFNYEVLLASNLQELLDLTAKAPPEPVAKAASQFAEIRSKAGTTPTSQYIANTFVRRRMAEITVGAPFHASAKLLAIQGAGNRPSFVRRDVLAAELRRAIEPMDWIAKHNNQDINNNVTFDGPQIELLGTTFEEVRNRVARLERYADKNDRELIEHTEEMVAMIRPLDRAARSRIDPFKSLSPVSAPFNALTRAYQATLQELATASGEPESAPH